MALFTSAGPRTLLLSALALAAVSSVGFGEEPFFETQVQQIFKAKCVRCHGPDVTKAELDLSDSEGVQAGGESGDLLASDDPADSLLAEIIGDNLMPPEGEGELTEEEQATILAWITAGAKFKNASSSQVSALTQHDVIPLLFRRCTMCHGGELQESNLDLRSVAALLQGGDSGPAIIPGKPDECVLVQRIVDRLCPPEKALGQAGIEPMTSEELATLQTWIEQGATQSKNAPFRWTDAARDPLVASSDRRFWSFEPPQKSEPPEVAAQHLVRNPIDAFLLKQLEAVDLTYSDTADRLTLLRRVTYDLTGLPPHPEQVERFLSDDQPLAYERMIERLLASPRYGERWARHWLDLAGYADSEGKRNADMVRPWAWRYRDYVIRSFNADKPYDQFLREQLAGDELVDYADEEHVTDEVIEKLIATGFLRMVPDGTSANPVNRVSDRLEVMSDEVDVVSGGLMGLSMKCARCHSHKYDPIPQRDYYRFMAVFKGAYDEYDWMTPQPFNNQWKLAQTRFLSVITPSERQSIAAHNAPLEAKIAELEQEKKDLPKEKSKDRLQAIDKSLKSLQAKLKQTPKIRALWDRGRPSPTYVYRRGEDTQPASLVEAGPPSALAGQDGAALPFEVKPPQHSSPKTGRRLAFANWLTHPQHPLTARVIVNRVWSLHFGSGIVSSLDNFGALGAPPSHPELLDFLAVEFVEQGWSIKELHRQILLSTAYRQSSLVRSEWEAIDPDNRLLSHMPMRRLSAEEVRDSLLQIAGAMNPRPFGPPDQVEVRKDGLVTAKADQGAWRRSIYVRHRRKEMPSILEAFDLPQMNPNCVQRRDSTVVSQSLHLLNNKQVYELAGRFAERVLQVSDQQSEQVDFAWRVALGRSPSPEESQLATLSLEQFANDWRADGKEQQAERLALRDLCHALVNSASFLYVD